MSDNLCLLLTTLLFKIMNPIIPAISMNVNNPIATDNPMITAGGSPEDCSSLKGNKIRLLVTFGSLYLTFSLPLNLLTTARIMLWFALGSNWALKKVPYVFPSPTTNSFSMSCKNICWLNYFNVKNTHHFTFGSISAAIYWARPCFCDSE